ncbi:hypothetical protein SMICM304S_06483 [Streptomyces microflavus]
MTSVNALVTNGSHRPRVSPKQWRSCGGDALRRLSSRVVLETTPESVLLNARCAPITSLLSRLTRAPVRVRVT